MAKKPTQARSKSRSDESESQEGVWKERYDRARAFLEENRYYVFLTLLVVGAGVGIFFWKRYQDKKELLALSREFASVREDPLSEERLYSEKDRVQALAAEYGKFFEEELAAEDTESLESILSRAEGTDLEPWVLYHVGNRHFAAGEYEKAIERYERFVDRFGEEGHVLLEFVQKDLEIARAEQDRAGQGKAEEPSPAPGPRLVVETTAGSFTVELDVQGAPALSENLLALARNGYYEGLAFYEPDDPEHQIERYPLGIGAGSPWGTGEGGPGYTLPRENLDRPITEGTLFMDGDGSESNGGRFWIAREKEVDEPESFLDFLATRGLSTADLGGDRQEIYQLYMRQLQGEQLSPEEERRLRAFSAQSEYQEKFLEHYTFTKGLQAWRIARSEKLDGKYSVAGRVVSGMDVVRKIDPGTDFVIRIVPEGEK
ncbi:MAG: peptidylprolyl isomerase [Planctomycetes bacterium]|nr:peptidylprolyl isomerase [Planctomycetota bacterium]